MADKIKFIDDDPDAVVSSLVTIYEGLTGRVLHPAQAERILLNSIGYRFALALTSMNETANKCFVVFADGQALEELGRPLGVVRLPAAVATCLIRFVLNDGHGTISIPAGIRVQSTDGQAVFKTIETKNILPEDTFIDVKAECITEGKVGNGYAEGDISVILDPKPYVVSASNQDVTANGGDAETDEQLRQRIFLAPSTFSVAGPKGAYKFFAKSAHPNIVDVAVTIGHDPDTSAVIPGQVDIFPLMEDGNDPDSEIIDAILAICNDDKVRPLTDTVVVKAPVKTDYAIDVSIVKLPDGIDADILEKINANLVEYRDSRKNKLGIDVVLSQIIAAAQIDKVYKVVVNSPSADIVMEENEFANCTSITATITGTHDQ